MPDPNSLLEFSADVEQAMKNGVPVVALESTIITHGMPWPKNLETARLVEKEVRDVGAVPATISIGSGRIRIGMDGAQLEALAKSKDAMKLSRADLAFALAQGRTGSTTVAATMMAAKLAGIDIFATGGIGGVHRDGESSMDISADLGELANTQTIVVCAGAKAILDIARTLEYLETAGVCVATVGSDMFPAFWSRESAISSPLRLDNADEIAKLWNTRKMLGQYGGLLIANPVPQDAEIPSREMETYISKALNDADKEGVVGKAVTPYLLSGIVELSGGRSLETNIALIRNNAKLAAQIACALVK